MSSKSYAQRDWPLSVNSDNDYTTKNKPVNTSNEKKSRDLSGEEVIRSDDEIKVNKDELRENENVNM